MTQEERKKITEGYFDESVSGAAVCFLLAALCFGIKFIPFQYAPYFLWAGIAFSVLCVLLMIFGSKRITETQFDEALTEMLDAVKLKSLQKAGIEEEELISKQVLIRGPRYHDTSGVEFKSKKGKNKIWRYSLVDVTVLNLTANQIIAYQCCLDLIQEKPINEITDEYFYKDVVSISTKTVSRTYTIAKGKRKGEKVSSTSAEIVSLTTSGGTSIDTTIRDPKLIELWGGKGGELPNTDAEIAIAAVRKVLREKKAA